MAEIDNTHFDQSDLNSVKRNKDRASYDKQQIKAIFKEARICHVAFIHDGLPQCIPMIGAIEETPEGDLFVYFHGAFYAAHGDFWAHILTEICFQAIPRLGSYSRCLR